jgi:predicted ATPase
VIVLTLVSVELHRFKAAFDPDPIQLDRFSLLIGRNGSGKSTVLEALQWIDTTLRRDAREASERYRGMLDLINLRSQSKTPYFEIELTWSLRSDDDELDGSLQPDSEDLLTYLVRVIASDDNTPEVTVEKLTRISPGQLPKELIVTTAQGRELADGKISVREPDRLALNLISSVSTGTIDEAAVAVRDWWDKAVFLRLSPSRLAEGAPAQRRSFDPLLDEEGRALASLLNELNDDQREELVDALQQILPGIKGVSVTTEGSERNQRANYSLLERMPYRGRAGRFQFPIPAWMLSEGTRRLTAILALLVHDPPPSFLSIEEIENGLDPWTVQEVLAHLQGAADRDTQVILTTHSPWLLDHVPVESVLLVRREEGNTEYRRFVEMPAIAAFDPSLPAGTRYVNAETSA